MKILLACEESQAVCNEFRKLGHEAFSCDILPTSGPNPEWHIQDDVFNVIKNDKWDLMIAFPPCTHLAVSGARHFKQKIQDGRQKKAIKFFKRLWNAKIKYICIENPVGIMSTQLRPPDQYIHPYYFGDPFQKKTGLWLKNLNPLIHVWEENGKKWKNDFASPTMIAEALDNMLVTHTKDKGEFITFPSGKKMAKWYNDAQDKTGHKRSKTFKGIAKAMAKQFSEQIKIKTSKLS